MIYRALNIFVIALSILLPLSLSRADYLGSWKIDDLLTFTVNTNGSAGQIDADSLPAYRIYEDETGTSILTGSYAKLDDVNTTGFYSEQVTLSAANGLEKGKRYTIQTCATISSVTSCVNDNFQVGAEVDVRHVAGTAQTARDIGASVLISPGTGTGQLDVTSGRIKSDSVYWNGSAIGATQQAGFPTVTIKDGTGTGEIDTLAGSIVNVDLTDILTTYTGNTPQTGDSFARIGTAGAGLTNIPFPNPWDDELDIYTYPQVGYLIRNSIKVIEITVSSATTTSVTSVNFTETANEDYVGGVLRCNGETYKKVTRFDASTDTVYIGKGEPWLATPSGTCQYMGWALR